jgi:short-subunit dehydrogenase
MAKTALITGASGGIGLELSRIFAQDGYDVVLVARNEDKLTKIKNALERRYGISAYAFPCDLSAQDAAQRVLEFTDDASIEIDVLVNNAGFGDCGSFEGSEWQKQYDMIRLNIIALMQLTHCYLPRMKERGDGKILNIASVASLCPGPNMSVYYASKAFVRNFSEALAEESREYGVTVTALCPGPVDTGFEKAANVGNAPAFSLIPLADPRDVALSGYKALMKGRTLTYYGFTAKAMSAMVRVLPRSVSRKIAGKLNKKQES